mgnify:CR=1 FL=1
MSSQIIIKCLACSKEEEVEKAEETEEGGEAEEGEEERNKNERIKLESRGQKTKNS